MFRPIQLAALAATVALPAFAATIQTDAYDLRVDIASGLDTDAYEFPPVSASLGYFPAENLEFGGLVGIRKADWDSYWVTGSVWELGIFGEKHMDVDFNFHPFVGLRLSLLDGEENSDTAYQAFLYAGGKVFITESMSMVFYAGAAAATEDIYDVETTRETATTVSQDGDSVGPILGVGFRYYF